MKSKLSFLNVGGFLRSQRGSITAETVIWLPVFAFILGLVADTSILYGSQARALRIVQDANRAFAVGKFADTTTTSAAILASIHAFSPNATASTTLVDGMIRSRVSMPARDLAATNFIPGLSDLNVVVEMQQMKEV